MDYQETHLNLLSINFNATEALNNLDKVKIPEDTRSLDNLGKAVLLLPLGIQENFLKLQEKDVYLKLKKPLSETLNYEDEINSIKNNEFKVLMKEKFIRKKNKFSSVYNNINEKLVKKINWKISNNKCKNRLVNNYIFQEKVSFHQILKQK